jgi:SAM-dependent methyltransferase
MNLEKLDAIEARTVQAYELEADLMFKNDPPGQAGQDLKFAFSLLPKNPRVLDVGCGYGRVIPYLRQVAECEYTGIDPSGEMLCIGNREFPKMDFRKLNLYELPDHFPEGHFDLVVVVTTMAYVTPARRREALSCIRKVVKAGGIGYFTFFSDDTVLRIHQLKPVSSDFKGPVSTLYGCSPQRSEPLLLGSGFAPLQGFEYTCSGMYSLVTKAF